jgi:biopolymer transport protein ExbB
MDIRIFHDGGPVFIIICLAGLAALAIFLERIVKLRQARIRYEDFLNGVFNILEKGKVREASALCDDSPGPVVRLMRAAILHRDEPGEALRQILDNTGRAEISRMERRLAALSTIMQAAPLLGLLGSLLGILGTVQTMRGELPLVQTLDITDGLVSALVTSIAGLAVAIPSFAMYNILVVRIDRIVLDMEQASGDILAFMSRWNRRADDTAEEKNAD